MTSAFEADDLMRRGLLSSVFGFKKKHPKTAQPACPPQQPAAGPVHSHRVEVPRIAVPNPEVATSSVSAERTAFDIYREIVSEVEHFERSTTATPLSELTCSTPTSPIPMIDQSPMNSPGLPPSQSIFYEAPFSPMQSINQSIGQRLQLPFPPSTMSVGPNGPFCMPQPFEPPPAYVFSSLPFPPQFPFPQPPPPPAAEALKPPTLEARLLSNLNTQVTLEEFVKLVVSAVKKEEEEQEEESPEEILRRKRQQNNEAAARYRKRQREAKVQADVELSELEERNSELKSTVERMQIEIELLKRAVLSGNAPSQ